MERRDFLKKAGIGTLALGAVSCAPRTIKKAASELPDPAAAPAPYRTGSMLRNYPGVGALGFGCMRWPMIKDENGNDVIDQAKVDEMIDLAMECGVNYFDTAPVYLKGMSESATAKALRRYPRERWLLATKLSNFQVTDKPYEDGVKMFRHSLEVFDTDYVDYYLLHSVRGQTNFSKRFLETGLMDFVLEQRRLGHIRNLGFSFHGNQIAFEYMLSLHEKYHWDFVQIQMNYLDWRHPERGNASAQFMYGELERLGIPAVIMEPLRGGALAGLPSSETFRLSAVEPGKSPASWALRFAAGFPGVLTVLSGMECMAHLEDNLGTFRNFKKLSASEMELLEEDAVNLHN
ncbi:MAG: aldo/keto reductase [Bacteroidales bacterium]|nr:aldo/keto reductase [Bacteroidales bacterium]